MSPLYDKQQHGKTIRPECTPESVKKEEDNYVLRVPKMTKGRAGSIYKHQYIDEKGGVIVIKAAEISLHIPPGALRERTFISIEVKSVANCDINGLETSPSLTPIVSCKPDGLIFEKTVELILPHCAEFDDIRLHKATAGFVEGHIKVSTDSTNRQDEVRCVLKERYCHVYTTHFSDVVVGISNCVKKRMLVVPFSGGSTKLYVKVWIINDLPSEYTILLQEQMELNFVPFNQTGKFILENHGKCSLKVQSCVDDKKLTEVSKDIDIKQLFRNVRSAHDFEIEKTVTNASQKFVTVSFLKEPVFCLQKEIQDGDVVGSIQKENCAFDVIETQDGEVAPTQTGPDEMYAVLQRVHNIAALSVATTIGTLQEASHVI
ncbi:Netrin receptor UNC5D [Holothuria leucospilota]|uniref:Netrin receptor UNC5D n=1 Tax=Holothuria leucospilota TaxID=206669 RepID=A0A9Q1CQZ8_HOLLE|nr:Netrin receptor UNC5D [Holothuria leucospilota]